ncbi:hypothetical protein [Nocardia sp. NPDC050175]|uniref:hypothetical protein n=1 Tax=Nocardia sp. NPDC050175 TaxID=3364317 RepID=UPI0037A4A8FB
MFTKRSAALGALILIATVIFGVTASPAVAETVDEREEKIATEIIGELCAGNGAKERSARWYGEYIDIQRRAPYNWRPADYDPMLNTLKDLYGKYAFNPYTRHKMCNDLKNYSVHLKELVTNHKGKIKDCCSTEKLLNNFFETKLDDLQKLNARDNDNEPGYKDKWRCDYREHECQTGKY